MQTAAVMLTRDVGNAAGLLNTGASPIELRFAQKSHDETATTAREDRERSLNFKPVGIQRCAQVKRTTLSWYRCLLHRCVIGGVRVIVQHSITGMNRQSVAPGDSAGKVHHSVAYLQAQ